MKKTTTALTAVLLGALMTGMTAVPAFSGVVENSAADPFIQVYTGTIYQQEWSPDLTEALAKSECPQVVLSSEAATAYPALAEAFTKFNTETKATYDETYATNLADAKERAAENPDFFGTYTDNGAYYVVRADKHVASLLGLHEGYVGGAHGFSEFSGLNFDPSSGNILKLSDFVLDGKAFQDLVKEQVLSLYPETEDDLVKRYFEETALDDMVWTAEYEGIRCYFNAYTLGPYAIGPQIVLIPYEGNEALFSEEAKDVPDSYGVEIPLFTPLSFGGRVLNVYGNLSEYGSYESISIWTDDKETVSSDKIYAYEIDATYLKANGKEYLYLQYQEDNDYRCFDVYSLGETPERIDFVDLGKAGMYAEDTFAAYAALSDPEKLFLSTRMDLLSTTGGYRTYRIGEDGLPEATEPYFHIRGELVLTTKTELSCKEVDEDGKVIGDLTLPAGTKMTLFRSDNDSIVDLTLEDGRIARVEVSAKEYPHTIDGTDIEELFDGIVFAG